MKTQLLFGKVEEPSLRFMVELWYRQRFISKSTIIKILDAVYRVLIRTLLTENHLSSGFFIPDFR
jgi:hypothetical protein